MCFTPLKWHYARLRIYDICTFGKLKYINILWSLFVSTNLLYENKNKQMNIDAFDLQEIKWEGQFYFLFWYFVLFKLSIWHWCLFVFNHYKWQWIEIGSSYRQAFSIKSVHNTTFKIIFILWCIAWRYIFWSQFVKYLANKQIVNAICKWVI